MIEKLVPLVNTNVEIASAVFRYQCPNFSLNSI